MIDDDDVKRAKLRINFNNTHCCTDRKMNGLDVERTSETAIFVVGKIH